MTQRRGNMKKRDILYMLGLVLFMVGAVANAEFIVIQAGELWQMISLIILTVGANIAIIDMLRFTKSINDLDGRILEAWEQLEQAYTELKRDRNIDAYIQDVESRKLLF